MGTTKLQRELKASRALTAVTRQAAHAQMVAAARIRKATHQAEVNVRAKARRLAELTKSKEAEKL